MRIISDFDDIFYPTVPAFLDLYKEKTGHQVEVEEINQWDVSVPCNKYDGIVQDLFGEIDFMNLDPIPGAYESLKLLNELHEIIVVTACTLDYPEVLTKKLQAMKKHFPFMKSTQFIPTPEKYVFDAEYIIEDSPIVAEMIYKRGKIKVLLMNKPWNQDCQFYHHRINSLKDVLSII